MGIKVNGVELQGDFFDADFIEKYEEATKKLQQRAVEARSKKYASTAEGFRDQISTVEEYFDDIFGEGAGAAVFADSRSNLMTHLKGVEELTAWARDQKKELNDYTNKYAQQQQAQVKQMKQVQKAQFNQFVANHNG